MPPVTSANQGNLATSNANSAQAGGLNATLMLLQVLFGIKLPTQEQKFDLAQIDGWDFLPEDLEPETETPKKSRKQEKKEEKEEKRQERVKREGTEQQNNDLSTRINYKLSSLEATLKSTAKLLRRAEKFREEGPNQNIEQAEKEEARVQRRLENLSNDLEDLSQESSALLAQSKNQTHQETHKKLQEATNLVRNRRCKGDETTQAPTTTTDTTGTTTTTTTNEVTGETTTSTTTTSRNVESTTTTTAAPTTTTSSAITSVTTTTSSSNPNSTTTTITTTNTETGTTTSSSFTTTSTTPTISTVATTTTTTNEDGSTTTTATGTTTTGEPITVTTTTDTNGNNITTTATSTSTTTTLTTPTTTLTTTTPTTTSTTKGAGQENGGGGSDDKTAVVAGAAAGGSAVFLFALLACAAFRKRKRTKVTSLTLPNTITEIPDEINDPTAISRRNLKSAIQRRVSNGEIALTELRREELAAARFLNATITERDKALKGKSEALKMLQEVAGAIFASQYQGGGVAAFVEKDETYPEANNIYTRAFALMTQITETFPSNNPELVSDAIDALVIHTLRSNTVGTQAGETEQQANERLVAAAIAKAAELRAQNPALGAEAGFEETSFGLQEETSFGLQNVVALAANHDRAVARSAREATQQNRGGGQVTFVEEGIYAEPNPHGSPAADYEQPDGPPAAAYEEVAIPRTVNGDKAGYAQVMGGGKPQQPTHLTLKETGEQVYAKPLYAQNQQQAAAAATNHIICFEDPQKFPFDITKAAELTKQHIFFALWAKARLETLGFSGEIEVPEPGDTDDHAEAIILKEFLKLLSENKELQTAIDSARAYIDKEVTFKPFAVSFKINEASGEAFTVNFSQEPIKLEITKTKLDLLEVYFGLRTADSLYSTVARTFKEETEPFYSSVAMDHAPSDPASEFLAKALQDHSLQTLEENLSNPQAQAVNQIISQTVVQYHQTDSLARGSSANETPTDITETELKQLLTGKLQSLQEKNKTPQTNVEGAIYTTVNKVPKLTPEEQKQKQLLELMANANIILAPQAIRERADSVATRESLLEKKVVVFAENANGLTQFSLKDVIYNATSAQVSKEPIFNPQNNELTLTYQGNLTAAINAKIAELGLNNERNSIAVEFKNNETTVTAKALQREISQPSTAASSAAASQAKQPRGRGGATGNES